MAMRLLVVCAVLAGASAAPQTELTQDQIDELRKLFDTFIAQDQGQVNATIGDPSGSGCGDVCEASFRPVCGTDGQTYGNRCQLRQASCNNPRITLRNEGPCVSANQCSKQCSATKIEVCATNGRTYMNKCLLSVATCEDSSVKLQYEGPCAEPYRGDGSSGSSTTIITGSRVPGLLGQSVASLIPGSATQGAATQAPSRPTIVPAILVTPAPRPVAPAPAPVAPAPVAPPRNPSTSGCPESCPESTRPVCGTDGKTYPNDCLLSAAACRTPGLAKRNDGVCPKNCNFPCPENSNPVCGSDRVTYPNSCVLSRAQCRDPAITLASTGACAAQDPGCRFTCDDTVAPVCGSDGVTYQNLCLLREMACRARPSLLPLFKGYCEEQQGSRCDFQCPDVIRPVCGNDGITYVSECQMTLNACRANISVRKVQEGPCARRT